MDRVMERTGEVKRKKAEAAANEGLSTSFTFLDKHSSKTKEEARQREEESE